MVKRDFKNIIFFFIGLLSLQSFYSCQKSSINGDLDGRWQIMEIETEGEIESVKDKQLYYNFYLHVCNLSYYGGVYTDGNFHYEDNKITLDFPYINTEEGVETLARYGIYSNPETFIVVYLDKKKLIMENDESLITLRKF